MSQKAKVLEMIDGRTVFTGMAQDCITEADGRHKMDALRYVVWTLDVLGLLVEKIHDTG